MLTQMVSMTVIQAGHYAIVLVMHDREQRDDGEAGFTAGCSEGIVAGRSIDSRL